MGGKRVVSVGPWGGSGGDYTYEFIPSGKISKIHIITGGQGGCIDSITFAHMDASGQKEYWTKRFGGEGGTLSEYMYLDHESGEEIMELSGSIGQYAGYTVITSLCFKTNQGQRCEFGSVSGNKFSLPVKVNGKFAGFHGRYTIYLDSIGAVLEPKPF